MVRQQPIEICDSLRAQLREFMRQRPDLSSDHFAQHTTLAPTTIRHFMAGTLAGGNDVVEQIRRVLSQAQCGEILMPGGPQSLTLTEDPSCCLKCLYFGSIRHRPNLRYATALKILSQ
jgi:hypothetical protein